MRPNYRALPWVDAFDLDIDTKPALETLREMADKGEASGEVVLALAASSLNSRQDADVLDTLSKFDAVFDSKPLRSKRALFRLEALQRLHRADTEIQAALEEISEPDDKRAAALSIATNAPTAQEAISRLHAQWRETHDSIALLSACEIAHQEQNWQFLSDNAIELFDAFRNISAARLGVYGAFNVQDFATVEIVFGKLATTRMQIPSDILRIRAAALDRMGSPSSIAAYSDLLEAYPTDENIYLVGYATLRRGDYAGVATLAQRVEGISDLSARTAFAFASWLRPTNPNLARALWRRGMALGTPADEFVLLAFHLAHELGISEEAAALREPMVRLGKEGAAGIRLVSQEDAMRTLREASERSATLYHQYRLGQIPVHILCSYTNANFLKTHVLQPRVNSKATPWTPVFVRHGGRRVEELGTLRERPFLDITSYLLAADLGLIDKLVNGFAGMLISDNLVATLAQLHSDVAINEGVLDSFRRTSTFAKSVEKLLVPYREAGNLKAEGITVVDWDTPENRELYEGAGVSFCTPSTLVREMFERGWLDKTTRSRLSSALGNVQSDYGSAPIKHAKIFLRFNTAGIFADASSYEELNRVYKVYLDEMYLHHVASEEQRLELDDELSRWLDNIIARLRELIHSGAITPIAATSKEALDDKSLESRVVSALFSTQITQNSMVVVDDRYMNAFARREDGVPVVSLWDSLRHLLQNEKITPDEFYEATIEMRRRGLMYLPIEAAEIEYFVGAAQFVEGLFTPTNEMNALARYISYALLDTEALYAGDPKVAEGPSMAQAYFVFDISSAVRIAIRNVLSKDERASYIRASWIYEYLSVDGLPGFGMEGFFGGTKSPQTTVDIELANFLTDIAAHDDIR